MTNFLTVATSLTDSLLFRWFALLAVVCLLIAAASNGLVGLLAWIDARNQQRLADEADDWDEPTRVQVESDTPIYTDLRREQFVADAMAEIETLTGGEVA